MEFDVSVSSIEFKTESDMTTLTSVKVNYSNGESSPTFEYEPYSQYHINHQTIPFDERPIRSVSGYFGQDAQLNGKIWVHTPIEFMDIEGETISYYNPLGSYDPLDYMDYDTDTQETYDIGQNEQIIGIYG